MTRSSTTCLLIAVSTLSAALQPAWAGHGGHISGGNVGHAVTMKHVPVGEDGRLTDSDGHLLDGRYPWLTVLRIVYDR